MVNVDIPALLRRLEARDEAALGVLYQMYGTTVYSLVLHVLRDTTLAQEVTQDTFMKLWNNPNAYHPQRGQFSSWLLTVARYTAIDYLRREIRHTGKNIALVEDVPSEEPTEELAYTPEQLQHFLQELPVEQRELIELAYFSGLTHSEMATHLHLPIGTIKTRLRLGLQKLRGLLLLKS